MLKLVLWDYTGESSSWCENFLRPNVYEVVRTLKPDDSDQAEVVMRGDWDYVLIFADDNSREVFDEMLATMQELNVATDNIIMVSTLICWLRNPDAAQILLNPATKPAELILRRVNLDSHKQWHSFAACEADGLNYVATSRDKTVLANMYMTGKTYAADDMQAFHALTKKFYGTNDSDGYFLDLGANIGTTGIYFLTKLAPRLKLFAVEPDAENFKLLRVNLILNDLDTRTTLVNCGLGEDFDTLTMYMDLKNPAANNLLNNYPTSADSAEMIQIAPLDYLLAESDISPEEVKYIWIDTEGFEPQVLFGAKNLLAKTSASIFMEYNPCTWKSSGSLDRLIDLLETVGYRHFIWVKELLLTGDQTIYSIENLLLADKELLDPRVGFSGDIFLIKTFGGD